MDSGPPQTTPKQVFSNRLRMKSLRGHRFENSFIIDTLGKFTFCSLTFEFSVRWNDGLGFILVWHIHLFCCCGRQRVACDARNKMEAHINSGSDASR